MTDNYLIDTHAHLPALVIASPDLLAGEQIGGVAISALIALAL